MHAAARTIACLIALVVASPSARATGTHGHGLYAFGSPATAAEATRTVAVRLTDALRIDLDLPAVHRNEVVRFVVTNTGASPHEFTIGDSASQHAHAEMMARMPDMKHTEDASALSLAPGETRELTWRFDKEIKDFVELACQIPGHYEGGMVSRIPFVR